jgi:hypothetical protein
MAHGGGRWGRGREGGDGSPLLVVRRYGEGVDMTEEDREQKIRPGTTIATLHTDGDSSLKYTQGLVSDFVLYVESTPVYNYFY